MSGICGPRAQARSFPVERAGPVLVPHLFPEAARAPRALQSHVLKLGPDRASRLSGCEAAACQWPIHFSMLAAAGTREPFDPWHCQLGKGLSGGEAHTLPTVGTEAGCPGAACEAQPFEPWSEDGGGQGGLQPESCFPEPQPHSLP